MREVGRGRKRQRNDNSNHGNLTPGDRDDNKRRTLYFHVDTETLPVDAAGTDPGPWW